MAAVTQTNHIRPIALCSLLLLCPIRCWKPPADQADREPGPAMPRNDFASGPESGYTTGPGTLSGYRRGAYKDHLSMALRKRPSLRYGSEFRSARTAHPEQARSSSLSWLQSVSLDFERVAHPEHAPDTPLKGILRKPGSPPSSKAKKVTINTRLAVYSYAPAGRLGQPVQKCFGEEHPADTAKRRWTPARDLKASLRHLFYQ